MYAADLGLDPTLSRPCQHPGNVWSLHGYHECLQRLGRTAEAAIIGQQLELARARADVPILASCACRLEVADALPLSRQSEGDSLQLDGVAVWIGDLHLLAAGGTFPDVVEERHAGAAETVDVCQQCRRRRARCRIPAAGLLALAGRQRMRA